MRLKDCGKTSLLLAVIASSLLGCTLANKPQDMPDTLSDTGWRLEALYGKPAMPVPQPTLDFGKDSFSGSDGCNRYRGSYRVDGGKISIAKEMAATMMACEAPVMDQAADYTRALGEVAAYRVDDQRLSLLDQQGRPLITLMQKAKAAGKDPKNATYQIESTAITFVDGIAKGESMPGVASRQVTRYFGNAVNLDLNGDGSMDTAFLVVQDRGGSGNFYYVVAALKTSAGYRGTNGIFIGDRIAPQTSLIAPDNKAQFIVSYADRKEGEPMAAPPTQNISRRFKFADGRLVENASPVPIP